VADRSDCPRSVAIARVRHSHPRRGSYGVGEPQKQKVRGGATRSGTEMSPAGPRRGSSRKIMSLSVTYWDSAEIAGTSRALRDAVRSPA